MSDTFDIEYVSERVIVTVVLWQETLCWGLVWLCRGKKLRLSSLKSERRNKAPFFSSPPGVLGMSALPWGRTQMKSLSWIFLLSFESLKRRRLSPADVEASSQTHVNKRVRINILPLNVKGNTTSLYSFCLMRVWTSPQLMNINDLHTTSFAYVIS